MNLTAITLGEDTNPGHGSPVGRDLAITKLSADQLQKMGAMLNHLVADLCEMDEDYPHEGSAAQKRNRDRVLRQPAFSSLMKDLAEEQCRTLSTCDTGSARRT